MELTILMPCLNEEKTVLICISKAFDFLSSNNIYGEVLIVDNGSTDNSISLIKKTNARIVHAKQRGYGAAIIKGIKEARGKYIIMGDCDDSYDFTNLMPFLIELRNGYELVMGNRYKGGISKGAMSLSHKVGVKFLTYFGNILYKTKLGDYHCGLRGFNKNKILKLKLECKGMDFASEIILKCALEGYSIKEIPTVLRKDGRNKKSHLRTIPDGILHVKCLLKYR